LAITNYGPARDRTLDRHMLYDEATSEATQSNYHGEDLHPTNARREFALILVLFVAFRALALLAFRPGGQVLDHSDFYWYREFAQLTRQGYIPYVNLWTTYPPLFPFLMIGLWQISTLLPPWEFPNLWFSLLLGGTFLLFETGNLILIYAMARRLGDQRRALRTAWFYTVLFTPVYTLTGWFESYPLFFFLLGLYLLLRGHLLWSALTTGIGFMIKLIPLILLPIGARLSGESLQTRDSKGQKVRPRWCIKVHTLNLSFDLCRSILYLGVFILTVIVIGLPFYLLNPRLVWGPLTISGAREPWETMWALLEGQFGYGIIPLDMRNVAWQPGTSPGSSLPWLWITMVFGAIYLFAYTRSFDWKSPRNVVAFSGFTLILFMLYSKGYSPQWLGWVLAFVVLLIPNLRGAFYALVTGLLNLVEANVFFTMVPDEHWLLVITVGLRTLIFVLLAVEFVLIIQPHWLTPTVLSVRRWGLIGLASLLVMGSVPVGVTFVRGYFEARYQLSPYQATIETLRAARQPASDEAKHRPGGKSSPGAALVLNSYDHQTYDWLYSYLRQDFNLYMLDDYVPPGESVEKRTIARLEDIAAIQNDWWLFDNDPASQSPSEAVAANWLVTHGTLLDVRDIDGGRLYHFSIER
jgi:hypothetical protein